jgi:hypothetical protein
VGFFVSGPFLVHLASVPAAPSPAHNIQTASIGEAGWINEHERQHADQAHEHASLLLENSELYPFAD